MSTPEQRRRMAESILNFEARREHGRLAVYELPANDGGGRYEVAGINDRYHQAMCDRLVALIGAGRHAEAEALATEYIAGLTDAVADWSDVPAVEFYLRDTKYNRGLGGVSRILRRALGTGDTGGVNAETLIALAAAEADVEKLLQSLRAAREQYERDVVGVRDNLWNGLVNRWNNALAAARGFIEPADGEPPPPPPAPGPGAPPLRLRTGYRGAAVSAWQSFLQQQGIDPGPVDGIFGRRTREATIAFQRTHALADDGIAGPQTLGKARTLGFAAPAEPPPPPPPQPRPPGPGAPPPGPAGFPPRPDFPVLVNTEQRQALFGRFTYVHAPTPADDRVVRITDNWANENIVAVPIPQLRRALGPRAPATVRFHRKAAAQLEGLWAEWEAANLLDRVLSYEGGFYARFIGGTRTLSVHAFGAAFDINEDFNRWGEAPAPAGSRGCLFELVPIANKWGFFWGGHFNGKRDAMHFEVARILP